MALNNKQVIVGAARLFLGSPTATLPAAVANTPYHQTMNSSADFKEVGYTQEGVEVSYEPEFGDVEVDQLLDSARIHKTSMRVTVNTTLAEATLGNLVIAWGQTEDSLLGSSGGFTDNLEIQAGALGEAPTERQLVVVGVGPEGANGYGERVYQIKRAVSTESTSHALRRGEATVFPVSFRILPDDNGSYGMVRDRPKTW